MKNIQKTILLLCFVLIPFFLWGQAQPNSGIVIRGTVSSKTNGELLPGVNVLEVNNTNRVISSTVTDINGNFVIKIKDIKNKLEFRFIGYNVNSTPIGASSTINMVLEEEVFKMEEVVIKAKKTFNDGGYSIPQKEISGAMQTVNTKEFEGVQVTSIDEALQGRIAGLDIVSNSGDLGSGTTMRMRGVTSINASSEPLIVVNGIPYEVNIDPNFDFANANSEQYANMLSINPDDIEDIIVMKDAASTAVWGSKGANGVISIITKKAFKSVTRFQYSYRLTRAVQPKGMRMLNGDEYTMLLKQSYFNPAQNEVAADGEEIAYKTTFPDFENFNNNTDWVDEVRQVGYTNDHYLTVTGGGEKAHFRVSGGFMNQKGTVIGQKMGRMSSRAYLDYAVSDRIKFTTEFAFTYTDNARNYYNDDYKYTKMSLLDIAYKKMPNVSVYKQDLLGNNTDVYYNIMTSSTLHDDQKKLLNPVALANLAVNNLKNYRILPTFRLQYDLLDPVKKELQYNMYVTFDMNNDKITKFLPGEASNLEWNNSFVNRAEDADVQSMTVMTDHNLVWQPKFSNTKHFLIVQGSFQLRTGNTASYGISEYSLPSNEIINASTIGYMDGQWTSRSSYRSMGVYGRFHYSFKERYVLSFTIRRDGSTKFGNDRKFGNFPGISAKWIISDEPFMKPLSNWLSMFAIRPSWGITGNQPTAEYLHYSRYSAFDSYLGNSATRPTTLQLSDLKWEEVSSFNYGFDIGFFNNKYVFDINFYNKRTKDLLSKDISLPSTSGFSTVPWQNIGIMDNDGWEVNFNTYQAIKLNKLQIDFNFNLSNYMNTIVDLREDILAGYNSDFDYSNGSYLTRIQNGNSYGSIYGFRYKGVYQYNDYVQGYQESAPVARDKDGNVSVDEKGKPVPMYFAYGKANAYQFRGGDAIYEDINHDGNIDELDIVYLGNSNPKFNGGFGSTLRYKNLSLTAFFNFRYGNKIVNAARMDAENMYSLNNQSRTINWRWRKNGDVTDMPRALYNTGYNWLGSDRYVEDGSFLRFKYLTFNYSVSSKTIEKFKLSQLNFYLTINNLYVFTGYSGVDPEVGYSSMSVSKDNSKTPRSKDFTLGLTIAF